MCLGPLSSINNSQKVWQQFILCTCTVEFVEFSSLSLSLILFAHLSHIRWVQKGSARLKELWVSGGSPGLVIHAEFVQVEGGAATRQPCKSTRAALCHVRQVYTWTQAKPPQSLHLCTENMAGMDELRQIIFAVLLCCCAVVLLCAVPQVSMEVCHEISVEMTKSPSSPPPSPKKGKGKAQKPKDVSPGIGDEKSDDD